MTTFLFAHPDYENELLAEAKTRGEKLEKVAKHLYSVTAKHNASFVWARDEWPDVETVEFESIAKGVAILKQHSKLGWIQVTTSSHRRGEMIEAAFSSKAKLARLRAPKKGWPESVDRPRIQPAFTLLSPTQMALCVKPHDEVPGGEWNFAEDREGPPSRAYLKLWEWGWRTDVLPSAGQTALDLGASPGGWTWVLAKAGLNVHAYDRSPLTLKLPKREEERIQFIKGDAFQVTPENAPATDWVFCDVIAEPKRTVELIESWVPTKAGLVFTIKFKGDTDFKAVEHLRRIPNSHVHHLDVNKHEVTFWRLPVLK